MEGIRGLKRLQLSSFLRFFDVFWNFCFEFRPIDENFKTSLQIFPQSACNFIHGQNVCSTRLHVSFDEIGANLKNFSHNFSPDENRHTYSPRYLSCLFCLSEWTERRRSNYSRKYFNFSRNV